MYDKEIVKKQLKKLYENYNPAKKWSEEKWDDIVSTPYNSEGFKIFRVENDGFVFIENTLIDWCPGYFAIPNIQEELS
ncbi:hypothetical protein [Methanobrevibacter smithii]|jgi:hypothetical protein|uniref:hypothetical protein n=1 Tax=Methanobrevibacter smithii TaxID=2173 RepID=UPI00206D33A1|nr:MAG TPA: hypothetical protein [Caudoviricetes sp.]